MDPGGEERESVERGTYPFLLRVDRRDSGVEIPGRIERDEARRGMPRVEQKREKRTDGGKQRQSGRDFCQYPHCLSLCGRKEPSHPSSLRDPSFLPSPDHCEQRRSSTRSLEDDDGDINSTKPKIAEESKENQK